MGGREGTIRENDFGLDLRLNPTNRDLPLNSRLDTQDGFDQLSDQCRPSLELSNLYSLN